MLKRQVYDFAGAQGLSRYAPVQGHYAPGAHVLVMPQSELDALLTEARETGAKEALRPLVALLDGRPPGRRITVCRRNFVYLLTLSGDNNGYAGHTLTEAAKLAAQAAPPAEPEPPAPTPEPCELRCEDVKWDKARGQWCRITITMPGAGFSTYWNPGEVCACGRVMPPKPLLAMTVEDCAAECREIMLQRDPVERESWSAEPPFGTRTHWQVHCGFYLVGTGANCLAAWQDAVRKLREEGSACG